MGYYSNDDWVDCKCEEHPCENCDVGLCNNCDKCPTGVDREDPEWSPEDKENQSEPKQTDEGHS